MFCIYFAKNYKKKLRKYINEIIDHLIKSIDHNEASNKSNNNCVKFLEEKLYLIESVIDDFTFLHARHINEVIESILVNGSFHGESKDESELKPHHNILSFTANPVKICVLIANLLNKLNSKHPNLNLKETIEKVCKLCNLFIDETYSIDEVNMMLKDQCYNGLKLIDVIGYSKIEQLMNNKRVCIFITNIWVGPYERVYSTSTSTSHEIIFSINQSGRFLLFNYVSDKSEKLLKCLKSPKKNVPKLFNKRNDDTKTHIFQYENWIRSVDCLYFIDCICVLTIAIIFQVLLYRVLSNSNMMQNDLKSMQTIRTQMASASVTSSQLASYQAQIQTLENETLNLLDYTYSNYDLFCNLILIQTSYLFKSILQAIYARLRRKVVEVFTVEQIINLITFVVVIITFFRWRLDFSQRTNADPRYNKLSRMNASYNDSYLNTLISSAIILCLQWSRVFLILQLSKTFGPMIEIISAMIKLLVVFAFLFAAIMVIFMFTGVVLFYDVTEFKTFDSTVRYLFAAALGSFDFSTYEQGMTVSKTIGYLYIALYEILMNITLLNFLIAILSEIYGFLKERSDSLYHKNIIRIKQIQFLKNKYYSCLVALPPPLNLAISPFTPFIVYIKSEKLNKILMHVCYAPVLITSVIIFTVLITLMLPFSYLILLLTQIRNLIKNGIKNFKSFVVEFLILVFVLFCGIIYLIILSCIDVYFFTVGLYSKNRKLKYDASNEICNGFNKIDPELFKLLIKMISKSEDNFILTKDLICYFRVNMKISEQLSKIIFCFEIIERKRIMTEESKFERANNNTFSSNLQSTRHKAKKKIDKSKIKDDFIEKALHIFIQGKEPKYLIDQYIEIKNFIITNSIIVRDLKPKETIEKDENKRESTIESKTSLVIKRDSLSIAHNDINNEDHKEPSEPTKVIVKDFLLQIIREESRKDMIFNSIYSIKGMISCFNFYYWISSLSYISLFYSSFCKNDFINTVSDVV